MCFKVFIIGRADSLGIEERVRIERDVLGDCADVEFLEASDRNLIERCAAADALIISHDPILDAGVFSRFGRVRVIVRNGVGYDNVDIDAAARNGITVCNVPDYGTEEVADHALALTLALTRHLKSFMTDVSSGGWNWRVGIDCRRNRGRLLGLIGCGRIGTAMALRSKAVGFRVAFYDPYVPSGYEKALAIERVLCLDDLLRTADILSIHAPLTGETHGMLGAEQFGRMKQSAYLVNTARGGIIVYKDLVAALTKQRIAGAALDVLENEPADAEELRCLPNCILTPHAAFYSQESLIELRKQSALIVRDALANGQYRNVVNGTTNFAVNVLDSSE